MTNTICLDENYSTTRFLTKEKPIIENRLEDKFETVLFLLEGENRKGEGGLRTKGYFKKSNSDKPLISIITVVFNGEKYLEQTIRSVIHQNYDNVEYIIIDGGSIDGTLDIIKKYEDQIDYWVSEKDEGIYYAMNKGISLSSGDLVGLINADDYYELDTIENVVISYQSNLQGDIFYGNMYLIDDKKNILEKRVASDWKLYFGMSLNHPATFITKKIYIKRLFNLDYNIASDYDFLLSCKLDGMTFSYIDKNLAFMRNGGESQKQAKLTQYESDKIKRNNLNMLYPISKFILKIKKSCCI